MNLLLSSQKSIERYKYFLNNHNCSFVSINPDDDYRMMYFCNNCNNYNFTYSSTLLSSKFNCSMCKLYKRIDYYNSFFNKKNCSYEIPCLWDESKLIEFKCNTCDYYGFTSYNKLKKLKFQCKNKCDVPFNTGIIYKLSTDKQCYYIGKTTLNKDEIYKKHMLECVRKKNKCYKQYKYCYLREGISCYSDKLISKINIRDFKKYVKCEVIDIIYTGYKDLIAMEQYHINADERNSPYYCINCNFNTSRLKSCDDNFY